MGDPEILLEVEVADVILTTGPIKCWLVYNNVGLAACIQ